MQEPEQRQTNYVAALMSALEEYEEKEKEARKVGDRLAALFKTINGLCVLTGLPHTIPHAEAVMLITPEGRAELRRQAQNPLTKDERKPNDPFKESRREGIL